MRGVAGPVGAQTTGLGKTMLPARNLKCRNLPLAPLHLACSKEVCLARVSTHAAGLCGTAGKHPWPHLGGPQCNQLAAMFAIAKTAEGPPRPTNVSASALDFLNRCLAQEPRERPTATELLRHPFVAG